MSKICNPESEKAKNEEYICNPETGRWVKRTGILGKSIINILESTPVHKNKVTIDPTPRPVKKTHPIMSSPKPISKSPTSISKPPDILKIGKYSVPALGMGTLPLGVTYGTGGRPEKPDAIKLIHYALDRGVRFFDTADTYGEDQKDLHYVEKLLTDAISVYRSGSLIDNVVIGTKTGMKRVGDTVRSWRPRKFKDIKDFREAVMNSYHALGSKPIKLWSLHHTDGYEVSDPTEFIKICNAIKELIKENIIENVGLCNCSTAHLDIARSIIPIIAVQNSYSLYDKAASRKRVRKNVAKSNKNQILEYCKKHNILFTPYGSLGGTQSRDGRRNLANDFPKLAEMAHNKVVSPQALTLSWMRHMYPFIIHIVGTRNIDHFNDYLSSSNISFTQEELDKLDSL